MKNDDTKNSNEQASDNLNPSTIKIKTNEQTTKATNPNKKAKKQKKRSLWQHWKSASRAKQIKWVAEAVAVVTGVLILGIYIWGNLQTRSNFKVEHRPKVIVSRPPELLGKVNCEVTDKAIHLYTGAMHIWVRNIRKGDAVGAFVLGPQFKLVPEKKIGNPFFDDIPSITDQTCKEKVSPKMKAFPVYGGQEVRVDMVQSAGTFSLVKTSSVTVTLGGPQKEPETPAGQEPDRISVAKDAIFQLYAPVCVYYFDEDGERYGGCRSYRFVVTGRIGNSNPYGFSCTESPLSGTFEETFFGYCEN